MDRARVEQICSLFGECTHQEQLSLLDRLPACLCRDFISLLPPEMVSMIMAYLDPKDLLNSCLLVSRSICCIENCPQYYFQGCWSKLLSRPVVVHRVGGG